MKNGLAAAQKSFSHPVMSRIHEDEYRNVMAPPEKAKNI
jgi:hypothetical protein